MLAQVAVSLGRIPLKLHKAMIPQTTCCCNSVLLSWRTVPAGTSLPTDRRRAPRSGLSVRRVPSCTVSPASISSWYSNTKGIALRLRAFAETRQCGADIPVYTGLRGQAGMPAPHCHAPSLRLVAETASLYLCWRTFAGTSSALDNKRRPAATINNGGQPTDSPHS